MKKLGFLIVLLIFSCMSYSTIDPEFVFVERIVEVDEPSVELFNRSMGWIAKSYVSAEAVIDYADIDAGTIIGKAAARISYGNPFATPMTDYMFTISVKTGKARFLANRAIITYVSGTVKNSQPISTVAQLEEFKTHINELVDSWESSLREKAPAW